MCGRSCSPMPIPTTSVVPSGWSWPWHPGPDAEPPRPCTPAGRSSSRSRSCRSSGPRAAKCCCGRCGSCAPAGRGSNGSPRSRPSRAARARWTCRGARCRSRPGPHHRSLRLPPAQRGVLIAGDALMTAHPVARTACASPDRGCSTTTRRPPWPRCGHWPGSPRTRCCQGTGPPTTAAQPAPSSRPWPRTGNLGSRSGNRAEVPGTWRSGQREPGTAGCGRPTRGREPGVRRTQRRSARVGRLRRLAPKVTPSLAMCTVPAASGEVPPDPAPGRRSRTGAKLRASSRVHRRHRRLGRNLVPGQLALPTAAGNRTWGPPGTPRTDAASRHR